MQQHHRPRLLLVRPGVSNETIAALEEMLAEARAGLLFGLAFVAIYHKAYTANLVGAARLNPTHTRGMIRLLDDTLAEDIRRGD
jgi:hypothetical protein